MRVSTGVAEIYCSSAGTPVPSSDAALGSVSTPVVSSGRTRQISPLASNSMVTPEESLRENITRVVFSTSHILHV